jgi:hypothetical protein
MSSCDGLLMTGNARRVIPIATLAFQDYGV